MIEFNRGYNEDCLQLLKRIPANCLDIICIDPPYLYLKGQKLERPFDEQKFFSECKRVLTKGGFIICFGRGDSFYRWNTIMANLGLDFKEEIIWNKLQISSPMNALSRIHETISIRSAGGSINKCKVDFFEAHRNAPQKINETLYRLSTVFGNRHTFDLLKRYYETGEKDTGDVKSRKHNATLQTDIAKPNRTLHFAIALEEGIRERSIIDVTRDHYSAIHPTQKPVRLLERLISLVLPKGVPLKEVK
jgi:site-specific DNA-methyltransferase (adenine-specific)